jgi:DNA-binding transcriptional regulator YiaG
MTKVDFTKVLDSLHLSKKEFAELSNISYNTVNNWNDENKPIPSWVESWLENYIKAKSYEDVKNKIFEIEKIDHKSLGDK